MPSFENVIEFVPRGKRGLFESAHWIRSEMDKTPRVAGQRRQTISPHKTKEMMITTG